MNHPALGIADQPARLHFVTANRLERFLAALRTVSTAVSLTGLAMLALRRPAAAR
jgi:hypothetical protein